MLSSSEFFSFSSIFFSDFIYFLLIFFDIFLTIFFTGTFNISNLNLPIIAINPNFLLLKSTQTLTSLTSTPPKICLTWRSYKLSVFLMIFASRMIRLFLRLIPESIRKAYRYYYYYLESSIFMLIFSMKIYML